MPTFRCAACGEAISGEDMVRDEDGLTYHYMCRPPGTVAGSDSVARRPAEREAATSRSEGVVITGIRVPFGTIFTLVSQVLAVVATYSLIAWIFASCVHAVLG